MAIPTIKEIAGVITEPEMRFTPQGKAVMSVRLAFNDSRYNEQTSQWENTKTFYVDATAWEQTAERLADQIRQGDQVFVEGRLDTQSWEKDGEKKSKPNLTIRTMRKLEKGGGRPNAHQIQHQQPVAAPQQSSQVGWGRQGGGNTWGGQGAAQGSWDTPANNEPPF